MNYRNREQSLRPTMEEASAKGDSVILSLAYDSGPARMMAEEIFHGPPPRPDVKTGKPPEFVQLAVPAAQVVDLLTRHAGRAGQAIAETLAAKWFDQPSVCVGAEDITLTVYRGPYPYLTQRVPIGQSLEPNEGIVEFQFPLTDMSTVSVVVPTVDDGLDVGVLIFIEDVRTNGSVTMKRPTAADLSGMLHRNYADKVPAIARAIRALRDRYKHKEPWLARVLRERPDLRGLARKVWRALEAL